MPVQPIIAQVKTKRSRRHFYVPALERQHCFTCPLDDCQEDNSRCPLRQAKTVARVRQ